MIFFKFVLVIADSDDSNCNTENTSIKSSNKHGGENTLDDVKKTESSKRNSFNKNEYSRRDNSGSSNLTNLSGITRFQNSIIDSDEEENLTIPKTPINISLNFKNRSSVMRNQKPIIDSDSEDDTPKNFTKKYVNVIQSDSEEDTSKNHSVKINIESDSNDNVRQQIQTTIESDIFIFNPEEEALVTVHSDLSSFESADEKASVTDDDQEKISNNDVLNISTQLNNTNLNAGKIIINHF